MHRRVHVGKSKEKKVEQPEKVYLRSFNCHTKDFKKSYVVLSIRETNLDLSDRSPWLP